MARPKKDKQTRSINMRIDKEVFDLLDDVSEKTGITKTAIMEKALRDYLESNKKELKAIEQENHMFDKYYDFFEEKPHVDGEVSMDEFLNEATRSDLKFNSKEDELLFYKNCQSILKSELFTCYCFLKERNELELYHGWRDGE